MKHYRKWGEHSFAYNAAGVCFCAGLLFIGLILSAVCAPLTALGWAFGYRDVPPYPRAGYGGNSHCQ